MWNFSLKTLWSISALWSETQGGFYFLLFVDVLDHFFFFGVIWFPEAFMKTETISATFVDQFLIMVTKWTSKNIKSQFNVQIIILHIIIYFGTLAVFV